MKFKWQDWLMASMNFVFTFSLLFQVFCNYKSGAVGISWFTIISSMVEFYIIATCLLSLKLRLSGSAVLTNAICWTLFLIQKIIYNF
jgi:hypothetical protein